MLDFRALWKELPCGSRGGSAESQIVGILKESRGGHLIADLVRKHGGGLHG